MRKMLAIAAMGAALFTAAATPAAAVDFIGGTFSVDANTNSNGLQIHTQRTPANGHLGNFTLNNVGDSTGNISMFKIWTNETAVNWDDLIPQPIELNFTFTNPVLGGSAGGVTGGYSLAGIIQGGYLTWDNGGVFDFAFGNGGGVRLTLTNADFNAGLFGVNEGKKYGDTVYGNFQLTSVPSAVPEPGAWALMITGVGMAGAALRRQRRFAVAAA